MNKRALSFKFAFFAIVAVSVVTFSVGIMVDEWNVAYQSGLTSDLSDYNELDTMSSESRSQSGNLSVSTALEDVDFEGKSIRGAFGFLSRIYSSFDVVLGNNGMLASVTNRFNMPPYIRQTIVTLMFFAIGFALIAIFFGRGRERI